MRDLRPCIYILTNKKNGTLYIGMSANLSIRLEQHLTAEQKSFVSKYKLDLLVHIEPYGTIAEAVFREKQLKHWKRAWKIQLIENANQNWDDLRHLLI